MPRLRISIAATYQGHSIAKRAEGTRTTRSSPEKSNAQSSGSTLHRASLGVRRIGISTTVCERRGCAFLRVPTTSGYPPRPTVESGRGGPAAWAKAIPDIFRPLPRGRKVVYLETSCQRGRRSHQGNWQ